MGRLLVLMISIGLADSLNPSTIAPALYLASGRHARVQLLEFTVGVFLVYLAGGCLIALGPGALVRSVVSDLHIEEEVRYTGEIVAGALLITAATLAWGRRHRMVERGLPGSRPKRKSSALLGAMITAVELPTAFPYFAAIAAVVGSGLGAARGFVLLLVFNISFVLPLLGILATLVIAGDSAERVLARWRDFLSRRWPHILVALLSVVGVVAILFGITGFASGIHGRVGRFFRRVRHGLHLKF